MVVPFLSRFAFCSKAFPMFLLLMLTASTPGVSIALDCTNTSIGVENKYIIPDSSFIASSALHPFGLPFHGRLNATYGWAAKTSTNPNDYLQVDLGFPYVICAVTTQGRDNGDEWVTEYKISVSLDKKNWTTYKENGVDKVFHGNTDRNSYVKNAITRTKARYVRFYPTKYKGYKVMRVGVFGYKKECETNSLKVENRYFIPNSSFTASSHFSEKYKAHDGRLGGYLGWASKNNSNPNDYLQVDLGIPHFICGVATQGNSKYHEWVMAYILNVSLNNKDWKTYQENGVNKVFVGNSENNFIQQHSINKQLVRYIRFIPMMYHLHKTMRVGLFGYERACENSPLGMDSGAIQDGSITASSAQHPAKNARLHYTSGSSWCASTSDSDPYLQIDLGSSHLICTVATQGNFMADQWVKTYQINTSTDGTTWTTYQENNIDRTFYGNYDRKTVVRQVLYHGLVTRYLRIVAKTYQTDTPCLRTEVYGYPFQTSCSTHSVGIPSRSLVPNHRFTATSTFDAKFYFSYNGRLGSSIAGWATKTNSADDYLQIDLGNMFYVCAVATQGNARRLTNEWVTKYKVMFSKNDIQWTSYNESGVPKEFKGNTNKDQVVTNLITIPFKAKFVRIQPINYHIHKTMRVDFKGLPLVCTSSLGLEKSQIPDTQMTSSSSSNDSHTASRGRLYGNSSWCSFNTSSIEYIQVDLGQMKTVTGIATQGNPTINAWVTSYEVWYSFDNKTWIAYTEGQVAKVFHGNTKRKKVIVHWLPRPIAARYVRILPQAWNTGICLRFDLYGCEVLDLPKAAVDFPQIVLSSPWSSKAITCRVFGEPAPELQWFNNGAKINGATQSTLQVQFISAEDVVSKYNCTRKDPNTRSVVCNTFYTCRATYPSYVPSGGMDEAAVKVTVNLNVPQAPSVTAVPFQRSIRLSWILPNTPDDVGAITNGVIEFNNRSSIKTISVSHRASPFTLTNLKPYTNYTVKMSIISTVGQGLWTKSLNVTTMIAEPDCIPTITSITAVTSQSIRINWKLNETDKINGPMAGYRIKYAKEGGLATIIDVGTTTTYTLTSLEKNTIYKVTLSVKNSLYTGNPSVEVKTRTLEDAPECAPVLKSVQSLSSNSVLLIWSSLQNQKCTNGVLRGYKVVYKESKNESNPTKIYTLNCPTAKVAAVTGLAISEEYKFQVQAFTVKDGPLSNSLLGKANGHLMILTDKMTSIVKAALNEKTILSCYANGAQPIRYIWTKDGAPIKSSSTKVIGNTVIVQPSNLRDYGTFLCKALSGKEVASYEIKLVPYKECLKGNKSVQPHRGKLTILSYKMMPSVNVAIGNKVAIGCFASGPQPITYKWTKNGALLSNSAVSVIDNILFIQPKTDRDYGRYLCNVSNSNQTASFGTQVKPLKNCGKIGERRPQGKLTILRNKMMSSVNVAIGNKAAIGCYATGVPPIKYDWTKDGSPISSPEVEIKDNILFVKPRTAEDYGKYRCSVSNKNETVSYVTEVRPLINCLNKSKKINQGKLKVTSEKMVPLVRASYGDKVSLGCYATGALPIKYSWTKDNTSLASSTDIKVLQNVAVVYPKRSSDYGTYVCTVTNGKETVSYSIKLLEAPPGNPKTLKSSQRQQEHTERKYLPFVIVLAFLVIVCILITSYLFWRQRQAKKTAFKERGIPMSAIIRKNSLGQDTAFLLGQPVKESFTNPLQVAENEI